MKILTILGARPQFIKAATLSRQIAKEKDIKELICHTGQHYDKNMSEVFFDTLKIPKPDFSLKCNALTHGAMTANMMEQIEIIAMKQKPDLMLVYGDTNSTLAGALVASKLHIKLAHIEAGLRSFNNYMPEEINRVLTDRVSQVLFCPTQKAVENLQNEGFDKFDCKIIKSGDIMYEGALYYAKMAQKPDVKIHSNFILCTIHRAENTDNETNLINIFKALNEISQKQQIILPLHPRTKAKLANLDINTSNLNIISPLGYLEMLWLIKNSSLVLTDSGGLQKEAFFFKKHCITLREETEWSELVEHKFNALAGSDKELIIDIYESFKFNDDFDQNLYGDEFVSLKILEGLR